MTLRRFAGLGALLSLLSPGIALAQGTTSDPGGTAWMLTATVLVLFLLFPLFNGDTTRSGYLLSTPVLGDFLAGAPWRGGGPLAGTIGWAFNAASCVMAFLPGSRQARAGSNSGPPNARNDSL